MVARTVIRIRAVSEETVYLHYTNLKNHVGQAKKRQNDNTLKHPARDAGRRIRHRPSAELRASAPRRTAIFGTIHILRGREAAISSAS